MHMPHQPTETGPDRYRGSVRPSPTSFVGFSGIRAVPVHVQYMMTPAATIALRRASHQRWYVPKMKQPPVVSAATAGTKLEPGKRWQSCGRASTVLDTMVSR